MRKLKYAFNYSLLFTLLLTPLSLLASIEYFVSSPVAISYNKLGEPQKLFFCTEKFIGEKEVKGWVYNSLNFKMKLNVLGQKKVECEELKPFANSFRYSLSSEYLVRLGRLYERFR